jgi:hypothetical protein
MNRDRQYLLDIARLGGEPDSGWMNDEGHDSGSPLGLHDTTLFDENESQAGDQYDPATGEKYDNSTSDNTGPLSVREFDREVSDELEDDIEWWFAVASKRLARARKLGARALAGKS